MKANFRSPQACFLRRINVALTLCCLWLATLAFAEAQSTDIILDCNQASDSTGINVTGAWTLVTANQDYGTGSIHDQGTGGAASTKTVRFTPTLPTSGVYRVYLWWRANTNRANDVPVRINHADGQTDVTVNQRANGEQWNVIGTFRFVQGSTNNVVIRTTTSTGIVGADAIRFSLLTPETIVDNTVAASSPGAIVSTSGGWSSTPVAAVSAYGGSYLATTTAASETGSATFNAVLPSVGHYDVYVQSYSPASGATSISVPLTISHTDIDGQKSDPASITESSQEARHWRYVGRYRFGQGTDGLVRGSVRFSNQANLSGVTITADAVRFAKVAESQNIVDNADGASAIQTNGTWNTGGAPLTKFGADLANNSGITAPREMTFKATLPVTTSYDVYLWWRTDPNNSPNVPVTITYADGSSTKSSTKTAVQNTGGGTWWYVGRYRFSSSTPATVKISTAGTTGVVVADAVCFVRDPDSDWDGIPDSWELDQFYDLETADATSDRDEDGISDLNECFQHTDPLDFFNGEQIDVRILSPNPQSSELGIFAPEPLTVGIYHSTTKGGGPWRGAPLSFSIVSTEGGYLSLSRDGAALNNPENFTAVDGVMSLYFKQPNTHGAHSIIEARVNANRKLITREFHLYTHLLSAQWKFDENFGTTINDSSPTTPPNPGTLNNSALRVQGFATAGSFEDDSAVSLDGISQYISIPEPSVTTSTNTSLKFAESQFTATAWIQLKNPVTLASDTDVYPVLAKWSAAGGFELILKGGAGHGLAFRIYGATNTPPKEFPASVDQTSKILNGGPHLIAFTRTPDNVGRLYLDGQEVGSFSDASGSLTTSAPVWIGRNAAGRYLKGIVDDVRLYTSALRADEIQSLYSAFDNDADGIADAWEKTNFGTLDLNGSTDQDGDGFTDWQEYVKGTNPNEYYDGIIVELTKPSGDNQMGAPGTWLALPLTLDVHTKGPNSQPLFKAPVQFSVAATGAQLAGSYGAQAAATILNLHTVNEGGAALAKAYVRLPAREGDDVTVNATASAAAISFTARTTGLSSHLDFNNVSGATAGDASGHNRTGTLVHGAALGDRGPDTSGALLLDGFGQILTVANSIGSVLTEGNTPFTISLWLKSTFSNPIAPVLTTYSAEQSASGFTLALDNGKLALWSDDAGGSLAKITSDAVVGDQKWHKVVVTYSGAEAKLYIDGQIAASGTGQISVSTKTITVGGGLPTWDFFGGKIDDVKFYRGVVLTSVDVDTSYNLEIRSFDTDGDGLTNWQELKETHTDPELKDTDDDGIDDMQEVLNGTNPNRPGTWNFVDIYISSGRAGHTFAIAAGDGSETSVTHHGLKEGDSAYGSFTSLRGELSLTSSNILVDQTTGDRLDLGVYTGGGLLDRRGAVWDASQTGVPLRQYFLVGPDRVSHGLLLEQPNGAYQLLTRGAQINASTVSAGHPSARFECSAVFDPLQEFWVTDIATNERSASNGTDLATGSWSPLPVPPPAVQVNLFLDPHTAGEAFTLHSRAAGGPERMESIIATVNLAGAETYSDPSGAVFTTPENVAMVSGTVGVGMEFWLTRDRTDAPYVVPKRYNIDDTFAPGSTVSWNLQGVFTALATPPQWIWVSFQVPNPGNLYGVQYADGTIRELGNAEWRGSGYYDEAGYPQEFYWGEISGEVNDAQEWSLVDITYSTLYPPRKRDCVDVWPVSFPPTMGWLTLEICGGRQSHGLQFLQSEGSFTTSIRQLRPENAGIYLHQVFDQSDNLIYEFPVFSIQVPLDADPALPNNSSFWVHDENTGENSPADRSDLKTWFPSTTQKQLWISSSRWGHDLWLCQPNGEKIRIQQHVLQGDLSYAPDRQAWFNSYYYFDATTEWHDFLDWWVEDRTANEMTQRASALAQTGQTLESFLITWTAAPKPEQLTATLDDSDSLGVKLDWYSNGAASEGTFIVERRVGGTGSWAASGAVLATAVDTSGHVQFIDEAPVNGAILWYRVSYVFGATASDASEPAFISAFVDTDQDGVNDSQEIQLGRDPSSGADRNVDSDGDGVPDIEELRAGTNPKKKDNPVLELSASGFTTP